MEALWKPPSPPRISPEVLLPCEAPLLVQSGGPDASIQPDRLASAIFADLVLGAFHAFCIGALTSPVGVSGAVEQAQAEGATA
jgi:hypothetical protein